MRIRVLDVFEMLAGGDTVESILEDFDYLEPEDIRACFEYAAELVAQAPRAQGPVQWHHQT